MRRRPSSSADRRLEAEHLARRGEVGPRVADVARAAPARTPSRPAGRGSRRSASATWLTLAGAPPATLKIAPARTGGLGGRERRVDDVVDVGEVARLLAVAVDRRSARRAATAVMKSGTTAAYCDVGLWRGPKTLK